MNLANIKVLILLVEYCMFVRAAQELKDFGGSYKQGEKKFPSINTFIYCIITICNG